MQQSLTLTVHSVAVDTLCCMFPRPQLSLCVYFLSQGIVAQIMPSQRHGHFQSPHGCSSTSQHPHCNESIPFCRRSRAAPAACFALHALVSCDAHLSCGALSAETPQNLNHAGAAGFPIFCTVEHGPGTTCFLCDTMASSSSRCCRNVAKLAGPCCRCPHPVPRGPAYNEVQLKCLLCTLMMLPYWGPSTWNYPSLTSHEHWATGIRQFAHRQSKCNLPRLQDL